MTGTEGGRIRDKNYGCGRPLFRFAAKRNYSRHTAR